MKKSLLVLAAATLLGVVTVGCGPPSPDETASPAATLIPSQAPTPDDPLSIVACFDASTSYPDYLRRESLAGFGESLRALPQPGFPGADIQERWITHRSREGEARLHAWSIPAIPFEPVRATYPPEPPEPDLDDPSFIYNEAARQALVDDYEDARTNWEEEVDRIDGEYEVAGRTVDDALVAASTGIDARNAIVLNAPVPSAQGSDLGGCAQKAGAVLARSAGIQLLVMASDMVPYGDQDVADLSLSGVDVRIVYFYCALAIECQEQQQYWEPIFQNAGATSVEFYDPDETIKPALSVIGGE